MSSPNRSEEDSMLEPGIFETQTDLGDLDQEEFGDLD